MDEVRLKDELMARLSNELDRPALQVIDGALSSVLRNYEISKRETGLSTNIISFPELDIFIGKSGLKIIRLVQSINTSVF
ncbi:hypothetical protein [Enterocloster sp.]|uniref:hypothetical protein n=1 Tax=Enterocloster sp. TaxID=2719315 RepID=UPI0039A1B420